MTAPGANVDHKIDDITDHEALIRYAVAGQLARLKKHGISQNKVGIALKEAGTLTDPAQLSRALTGPQTFRPETLRNIDELVVAILQNAPNVGGLAQFGVRMRNLDGRDSLLANVPMTWIRDSLGSPLDDELLTLTHASTFLNMFLAAKTLKQNTEAMADRLREQLQHVVDRLILIACGPPTPRNIEAQILLGSLAKYAFDVTFNRLARFLRTEPLGFRVWRAITKLVTLSKGDPMLEDQVKPRLGELFAEVDKLRQLSIYPGRALDLELAISIPKDWLQPRASVTKVLLDRVYDSTATLRERGTAAMGLWERAICLGEADEPTVRKQLAEVLEHLETAPALRPDIDSGLRWVATTLSDAMTSRARVSNNWPEVDEPWFHAVQQAALRLMYDNIPRHLRAATASLFKHMILQNAGVERRLAVDTVIAAGLTEPVARALETLRSDKNTETWVRIRALFALGFLQYRDTPVPSALATGCAEAYHRVNNQPTPNRASITELHTALFSIGDALGVEGAQRAAKAVRDELTDILTALATNARTHDVSMHQVARALAYQLTFTAQPRRVASEQDLSEALLTQLGDNHPDDVTRKLCKWALGFRFGPKGEIRPLLAAAKS